MDEYKINTLASIIQATLVTTVGYPFDLVKTKLQANKNITTYQYVKEIIHNGGIKNLYKGSSMPWLSHMIKRPIQYPMSEFLKKKLNNNGYTSKHYNYMIGGIAGVYGSIIGNPLQVIKIAVQTQDNTKNSIAYIKYNFKNNGIRGFYRGLTATAIKDFMFGSCYMGTYYTLRDIIGSDIWWKTFISGSFAQSLTWSLLIPIDFIKTSIQKSERKITIKDVIKSNYKKHGIRIFWKGVIPACVRTIPVSGTGMVGYESIKHYLNKSI